MTKMLKVKANKKLNFGHLEGMPEGKLAYLSPGDVMELPECYIVNFYLKSGFGTGRRNEAGRGNNGY